MFSPNPDASVTADGPGEAPSPTVQGVCPPGRAKEPRGGQQEDCVTAASIHIQLCSTWIYSNMTKFTTKGTILVLLYMYSGGVLLGYYCYNSDCVKM